MKNLLLFLTLFVLINSINGQNLLPFDGTYTEGNIKSRYDTIIHFKGLDTLHNHIFVSERQPNIFMTLAIGCPPQGCEWDWLHIKKICTTCLRHLEIQETRWIDKRDEYKEALEKLNKLLK